MQQIILLCKGEIQKKATSLTFYRSALALADSFVDLNLKLVKTVHIHTAPSIPPKSKFTVNLAYNELIEKNC
jgi:predicted transcriptional regulator